MTNDGIVTGADIMRAMPDRITDGPQFEESHESVEWPDGTTVTAELSNALADEYILDEAVTGARPLVVLACELAVRGDSLAAAEVLKTIYRKAGESEQAREDWRREKEWAENGNG